MNYATKDKILKNLELVFKTKNINKLNKSTYKFLCLNGFIAHYDINGFKAYYQDIRNLIKDLENSIYYEKLKDVLKLIDKYKKEINAYYKELDFKELKEKLKVYK